jgi:hypothetical protein
MSIYVANTNHNIVAVTLVPANPGGRYVPIRTSVVGWRIGVSSGAAPILAGELYEDYACIGLADFSLDRFWLPGVGEAASFDDLVALLRRRL